MNEQTLSDENLCPFCGHELEDDMTVCEHCGSTRVRGYISKIERRIMLTIQVILCGLTIFYFWNYYDDTQKNFLLEVFLFAVAILLSIVIPLFLFKLKNKRRVMWKRRVFSM